MLHRHKCEKPGCGVVWEHGSNCRNQSQAHSCPRCGTMLGGMWEWYKGDEPTTELTPMEKRRAEGTAL